MILNGNWHRISAISFMLVLLGVQAFAAGKSPIGMDPAMETDWMSQWSRNIQGEMRTRYCDTEMGEELGWLVSPIVNGFYYGYRATGDTAWVDRLVDWTDSWLKRGVKEPDGCIGWPKANGASTEVIPNLYTDNMLGEAMALRPAVLMAGTILSVPSLTAKYGHMAREYIRISEEVFDKWNSRDCWRRVKNGGVWVAPEFGIDQSTGKWTSGYADKAKTGFTLPDNKQNLIAMWLIAMYDVTKKPIYRDRAAAWWSVMKSRIRTRDNGKYDVWDYWEPAGAWDYKSDGSPKQWIGVHPNGGYYQIDVESIVCAYEHHLVFAKEDIDKLIATNRDFMWNHVIKPAKFQRIDGGAPDPRWAKTPGLLWYSLTPYDPTLRKIFEENHNPSSWGGMISTPWFVGRMNGKLPTGQ
jgi:hypothetical protein